jgi:3-deoxy-alpha-D-manno-octulosonate 8-oxidase
MDFGKAISNLLGNSGPAEKYQGWELLENRGSIKIGVPTIFGSGSESSRTCVLFDPKRNMKLGMNSPYSLFDSLIIDPGLIETAPRKNIFFSSMDGYFHATEILRGKSRLALSDSFAKSSLIHLQTGIRNFLSGKNLEFQADLALGSLFGGIALANGMVGVVHPFSAALSVVFGIPHGEANCIAFGALSEFYPEDQNEINYLIKKFRDIEGVQRVMEQELIQKNLDQLYEALMIHEKPLVNHLGQSYKMILTQKKVNEIFLAMVNES